MDSTQLDNLQQLLWETLSRSARHIKGFSWDTLLLGW